jgi:hypothetical protein
VRQTLGEEVSERRACKVLGQPRRTQRYLPRRAADEPAMVKRMLALVTDHPRFGYRMIWALPKQESWHVHKKRIWRPWKRGASSDIDVDPVVIGVYTTQGYLEIDNKCAFDEPHLQFHNERPQVGFVGFVMNGGKYGT